ncbi:MAG TPA: EamA family transporter [Deltaproteobacteria bacterium]|nr:EamA family transporter [Deltaproteobacteria bacterium]HPR54281.1 EamA family transporter [Deltaproteobacteria bacterium]HXK45807.1 EamA family transporter [Deltaproteobacteria bacterium]
MKTGSWKGYLSVTAAALMWASCGTAGKALFNAGISPFILVQTRVTLAALFLIIFFSLYRPALLKIRHRDIGYLILFGGVFMAIMQLSYFMAISRIQVAAAILLQYLAPGLVACFSFLFWKERITPFKTAALLMSLIGCYLVVGGYDIALLRLNHVGIIWGLISALAFASTTLLGERVMHRYNPWTVLTYGFLFSSLALNLIHRPASVLTQSFTLIHWATILYIVIIGTLIPFGLYLTGVNYIRSTRTIITATLEPITAAFLSFFLLGEAFEPLQIIGGITVLVAIMLLQRERELDELSPETIRGQTS